ncbi:alpha/beta family hydrolase [Arsukibacterium sp.]|uniref:alpha/beta family hydrolase n=1 Tax=Arsukibacterium sp. TaxID=1977258 RepID=UPI002FD89915
MLTHGAGAGCNSDFMQQLVAALDAQNIAVSLFNFSYMRQAQATGVKRPPAKMPVLLQELEAELAQIAKASSAGFPLFIGGKSMGGRVASMLQSSNVKAIFAFSYPFHPPGKSQWRTAHFDTLNRPLFIMQGERDPFGQRAELAELSWPQVRLKWLATGDHDFKPTKASGLTQQQLISAAATYCSEMIDEILLAS